MKRIAVFASGSGTDFQSVIDANEKEKFCEIVYLIASKDGVGAIDRAKNHGIPTAVFAKNDYPDLETLYGKLTYLLNINRVDYIVLAGWLKIIPDSFIEAFKDRIINIHPSLIPAFCGSGFYGLKVHQAVLDYGAKVSGCTCISLTKFPTAALLSRRLRLMLRTAILPKVCKRAFWRRSINFFLIALKNCAKAKFTKTAEK